MPAVLHAGHRALIAARMEGYRDAVVWADSQALPGLREAVLCAGAGGRRRTVAPGARWLLSETDSRRNLQLPRAGQVVIRSRRRLKAGRRGILRDAVIDVARADSGTRGSVVILRVIHGVDVGEVEQVEGLAQDGKFESLVKLERAADAKIDILDAGLRKGVARLVVDAGAGQRGAPGASCGTSFPHCRADGRIP